MSGRLFGYAHVSVASDIDANNLETKRRVLADCEQVFVDVGSGASWNRPWLNRLRADLQPCDCVKVRGAGPPGLVADRGAGASGLAAGEPGRGHESPGVHRSGQAMGRAMLHRAIVFAQMERDLA